MSNNDLEEGDGDFTIHCHDPVEGDSVCIKLEKLKIDKLELLKQEVFIDAYKN